MPIKLAALFRLQTLLCLFGDSYGCINRKRKGREPKRQDAAFTRKESGCDSFWLCIKRRRWLCPGSYSYPFHALWLYFSAKPRRVIFMDTWRAAAASRIKNGWDPFGKLIAWSLYYLIFFFLCYCCTVMFSSASRLRVIFYQGVFGWGEALNEHRIKINGVIIFFYF